MRALWAKYAGRLPGLTASLLLVLYAAPLSAKTITVTVTPTDSHAVIADLQPLFGIPWKLITSPSALAFSEYEASFVDDQCGFLCTLDPEIAPISALWRYDRGRWQRENPGSDTDRPLCALFALSRRDLWLSFHPDRTLKQDLLHYDGQNWRHIQTPNSDRIRSLFMLSPTSGWAGCEWGQIMRYEGTEWQLMPFPTGNHITSLLMLGEHRGVALTRAHRREGGLLHYDGLLWQNVRGDSLNWLDLFMSVMPQSGISAWPIDMLTGMAWLERPAAMQDTLFIDAPLHPGRLIFTHPRGTLLKGHLARSFQEKRLDWIAKFIQPPRPEGRYVWLTCHFFNQKGDKRILIIRLQQAPKRPVLFEILYLLSSSLNVAEHGTAIADYNGDGTEDLFVVTTGAANRLYLSPPAKSGQPSIEAAAKAGLAGSGTLATGIANYDEGAAAADVDNDGDQDILVTSLYGPNLLYRQMAPGRFREESKFAGIDNCLARTCSAVWADVNQDGAIDFYLSNEDSTNRLYLNNGAGIFRDVTREAGLLIDRGGGGSAFGDMDNDGDPDLFVPRYGRANLLYLNQGGAIPHFHEYGREAGVAGNDTLARSTSTTWGDVDNDGDLDLFVTNLIHSNWLYLNDGHGHFQEVTAARGLASHDLSQMALLLDADNDGDLDLLIGNRGFNRYYANQGKGYFQEATRETGLTIPANTSGMAFFDQEEDGDLDVWLGQNNERSILYRNSINSTRWLETALKGDGGNRDAIGARLWLYREGHLGEPDHLLGMREINGGSGYNSMSSRIAHFGAPDEGRLALRVRFPSGAIREIDDISPGQRLVIHESEGWHRSKALLVKWMQRLRANPQPRIPIALLITFAGLLILFELCQLHYRRWPARTVWLMVVLPGTLLLLLLVVLSEQPAWRRYSLGLGLPLIAWALSYGLYLVRQEGRTHTVEDLEKLYLAVSAFFHGEWAARKLNRLELYSQNLEESQPLIRQVADAFAGVIDDYFTMIVPELEKILELAAGSQIPEHLRTALKTAMLNLTTSLSKLKVDLRLGTNEILQHVVQRSQILQMELLALRKHVAERFSSPFDLLVVKTLEQNRHPGVEYCLVPPAETGLWARIPGYAFSQILENLLDNAHTAIASAPVKQITLEMAANADYLFLRVRDSGTGVPETLAERLFVERVSTKARSGGFGLYHARAVLTKFGGAIRLLEQEDGHGAAFEIILKRIDNE